MASFGVAVFMVHQFFMASLPSGSSDGIFILLATKMVSTGIGTVRSTTTRLEPISKSAFGFRFAQNPFV
jgi:hypothetical protein